MNKKRLIISSVISIFLVSVLLLGSTYSIFTSQEIDETANVYKTGNLNVTYKVSSNTVHFTDPTPMTIEEADAVIPYRVTVTNSGNVPYEFDVILLDTTSSADNTIDYQYIMTKVGYLEPKLLSDCTNNIIKENVIVPAGEKVDIDVRLWLDSPLLNTEMGKSFYAKLKIDGLAVYNDDEYIDNSKLSLRYMNGSSSNDFRNDAYRTYIKTASFVDYIDTSNASINVDTNKKIMWDMSTTQDESVIAWLEDNGEIDESGNKLYDLYIGSKERIYAKDLGSFFSGTTALETISFNNLDTSLTTRLGKGNSSYYGMFENCKSLTDLDVSNFDTSNVIYMDRVFNGCRSLTSLDLSNWNTSNVKTIQSLFRYCDSLISLDLSNWDTSNVTSMSALFMGCVNLSSLDISNFNTSNVSDMSSVFYDCRKLMSIDIKHFDTSNVTNMRQMFENCTSLIELDVSGFNTNQVIYMQRMFNNCSSLIGLDLSNFNTSNVVTMEWMFRSCASLIELDLSSFETGKVTTMYLMFAQCSSLTSLDLSNFDTRNVTNMNNMFSYSGKVVTTITIRNANTTYNAMFEQAATAEGAQIIVNYIGDDTTTTDINESTESLVDAMIATKPTNSNVVKGELVA